MSVDFDPSRLTREEREILIRKSEADSSFDFFTTSPIWKAKLERLGWSLKKDHQGGWSCLLPENAVTIRKTSAVSRTYSYSDEQKIKMRERGKILGALRRKRIDI